MDGAHIHQHGPTGNGTGTVILVVAAITLAIGAAHAVAAILPALLFGLPVTPGRVFVVLSVCWVLACRHRQPAWHRPFPGLLPPESGEVSLAGDREVVSLRRAMIELHAQLAAARALDAGQRPGAHQHLHFHGVDPAEVAAILAAYHRGPGDDE